MANALNEAYQQNYQQMQNSGAYNPLSMENQTLEGITDQLAAVYRPQLEQEILNRQRQTKAQKASIDVDAASRGMGTSTWVTDRKNRIMDAEASDIAMKERDYASQMANAAINQYNQWKNQKLQLDQYNQAMQQQLGAEAYQRATDQYNAGLIAGTLPAMQNQLAYNQNQWAFDRAQAQAPLEDKMNQLSYDQAYLNYLQSQWQFDQAKNAAKGGGGSGGSSKKGSTFDWNDPSTWSDAFKKYMDSAGEIPPIVKGLGNGAIQTVQSAANYIANKDKSKNK